MIWKSLIGLKILAIKGNKYEYQSWNRNKKVESKIIKPLFIFFDDKETYIQLEEQDYYSYHDCSSQAREIYINKNKKEWENLYTNPNYIEINTDL